MIDMLLSCIDCVQGDAQNRATGTQGGIGTLANLFLGDSEGHLSLEGEEHVISSMRVLLILGKVAARRWPYSSRQRFRTPLLPRWMLSVHKTWMLRLGEAAAA